MFRALCLVAVMMCWGGARALAAEPATQARTKPQYIILKLDDVVQVQGDRQVQGDQPVHPLWQRVSDYLEQNKIKAGFGIICQSLEHDNPKYFDWIKERQARGDIEFWCHGYHLRSKSDARGEFEVGSAAEQQAILEKCEKLAREKLGFELPAFGAHWSGMTEETEKAVQAVPEIKMWLNAPPQSKHYTRTAYLRVMALENPTFKPDPDKFVEIYNKVGDRQDVLVLQGHPAAWTDEARWDGFLKIIDFLKSKGCIFTTPSEYRDLAASK